MIRRRTALLIALLGFAYSPGQNLHGQMWSRPAPYLTNAHISLIYWGTGWIRPASRPSHADFTAALHDIITGPWSSQLNQYHVGPTRIDEVVVFPATDPPAHFTDRDVRSFLEERLSRSQVAPPAPRTQRIYTVLLPDGIVAADPSVTGRHLNYVRNNSAPVYLAWVLNDGTLTGANSIPKMFSHELAETLTDADISTGQHGITLNEEHDEIADVCNHVYKTVNGHAEQAYWSVAASHCVLPTASVPLAQPPPTCSPGQAERLNDAAAHCRARKWPQEELPGT